MEEGTAQGARVRERWARPESQATHTAWGQLGTAFCASCRWLRSGVVWKIHSGKISEVAEWSRRQGSFRAGRVDRKACLGQVSGRAPCSGQAGAVNESANLEVSLGASREDSLRLGPPTYKTAPAPQRGPRASEIVS